MTIPIKCIDKVGAFTTLRVEVRDSETFLVAIIRTLGMTRIANEPSHLHNPANSAVSRHRWCPVILVNTRITIFTLAR